MQAAEPVDVGRLVEFSTKGGSAAVLGAVVAADGKKNWKVVTATGREVSVPPRAISHVVAGSAGMLSAEAVELFAATLPNAEEAALEELWEMSLDEDGASFSLDELSELLHGAASPQSRYATHLRVGSGAGRIFFRARSPGAYEPRPAADVRALRSQAEVEAAREAAEAALRERVQRAVSARASFDLPAESEAVQADFAALARLGSYAALDDAEKESAEEPTDAAARDLLRRLGRKAGAANAATLLKDLGLWSAHENLDLIRLRVPTEFPPSVLAAADEIAEDPPPDPDAARRKDLTHLVALAIDDAATVEVDDALSVEVGEGGAVRIWIHIADPSRYVALGSALDREARQRGSTVYLPTGQLFMFPRSLATGAFSLRPDTVSCALSIGLSIDADGAIAQDVIITPSLVRVQRLAYSEVDDLLARFDAGAAPSPVLDTLRRLEFASSQRNSWRVQGGAMADEVPDTVIKARRSAEAPDGWDVEVGVGDARTGAARRIVTESMLLAGEAVARYGLDHGVPMAFRAQTRKGELSEEELEDCPPGPCRWWLAVRQMIPSTVAPDPRPHDGLGLDEYTQVTSPIRRYADLALHYQLKAHLRGEELPFAAGDLVSLAAEGGKLARLLERRANQYWLQEYFRRHAQRDFQATVLGKSNFKDGGKYQGGYKLLLDDLGAIVDYKSTEELGLGVTVQVTPGELTV